MKNLEISTYGVEEMNSQEMLENEGGSLTAGLIFLAIVVIGLCTTSCVNSPVTVQVGDNNTSHASVDSTSTSGSVDVDAKLK
jgi:hypothetical protein